MTHDGLGKYLSEKVTKAKGSTVDVTEILKETGTDVVVNYLPVGSRRRPSGTRSRSSTPGARW
jgi:myo-inositol-1-phosphate synthase